MNVVTYPWGYYCCCHCCCSADPNTFDIDCLEFAMPAWGDKKTALVWNYMLRKNSFSYYNPNLFFHSMICTKASQVPFPTAIGVCTGHDRKARFYMLRKFQECLSAQVQTLWSFLHGRYHIACHQYPILRWVYTYDDQALYYTLRT